MPTDAPKVKIDMTKSSRCERVVTCNTAEKDDRVAMANALAEERDWPLIPSFDDAEIIAGQGTANAGTATGGRPRRRAAFCPSAVAA